MTSTILVTGAAGFAGSHLVESLTAEGAKVVAWYRPGGRSPFDAPGTVWQAVDLFDAGTVRRTIEQIRPSVVYHCAGATHVGQSWDAVEPTLAINVRGTHILLDALARAGSMATVLITSTAMVYRPGTGPLTEAAPIAPANPYGLSKLAQEMLGGRASGGPLRVTIGRAFNHIGPRQSPSFAAAGFARQIAEIELEQREPEVVVGNLGARRDTLDVRDTVRAYRAIVERGHPGRPYNICSGHALAVGEMLEMLRARARVPISIRVDPERFRPNDLPILLGDSTRLREELEWTPAIPLSKTLDDLLDYWRLVLRGVGAGASA